MQRFRDSAYCEFHFTSRAGSNNERVLHRKDALKQIAGGMKNYASFHQRVTSLGLAGVNL
jgi:hypothetical protein